MSHPSSSKPPASKPGVPIRSEVRPEDTWDLTPLYAQDSDWESDFQTLESEYQGIVEFSTLVGESAKALRDVLEFETAVSLRVEQLNQYAALRVTEDSSDSDALTREARLENLLLRVGAAFAFVVPEIQAISDETFGAYLEDEALSEWVIPLHKIRRLKPHTLTANEERLMALGSSAIRGHGETFSQLTNVDMTFGEVTDSDGVERELTQSSFSSFLQQPDPKVRKEAFKKFYAEFSAHQFTIASSLASSVRADVFYARARNHPSAIEGSLFSDDVPLSVYDNLIASVRGGLEPLLRSSFSRRSRPGFQFHRRRRLLR